MRRNVTAQVTWATASSIDQTAAPAARRRAKAVLAFYAASAGELPLHKSLLEQRFREVSAVVSVYLEGRGERPEHLPSAELAGAYRLALDLHGIINRTRTSWSRDWNLELAASGERLYAAAPLARAYRPHAGTIPASRMAALSVATALIAEVSVWHDAAAKPACAPDFMSLLQAASIGLSLHREQALAAMSDFEILKLACDTYHQYGGLCWGQAQPTAPVH